MMREDPDVEATRAAVTQPLAANAARINGEHNAQSREAKDADNVRVGVGLEQDLRSTRATLTPSPVLLDPQRLDWRAVWQLCSMSLGIGVFAIPYAFTKLGVLQGTLWVVVLGFFANFAQQLLLEVAAQHNISSYEDLAEHAFGKVGKTMMTLITLVTTFIASLTYIGAAKELLVGVVIAFFLDVDINSVDEGVAVLSQGKDVVLLIVLVGAVMPLCLSPTMGGNAWISKGGVVSITTSALFFMVSCVVLLANGCSGGHCGDHPELFTGSAADAFQYTATLAFSYSMIFAVFPVLSERVVEGDVATAVEQMKPAVATSVATCSVIYVFVGSIGATAFGSATRPVALSNFALSSGLTQAITLLVGVSSTLLVAIVSFPTVCSLELLGELCRGARSPNLGGDAEGTARCTCFGGPARPWLVVLVGMLIVVVDVGLPTRIAFALCGSLGLATAAYVMPCLLFLKLDTSGAGLRKRMMVTLILFFGCLMLFGSTPVTVYSLLSGNEGNTPEKLSKLLSEKFCHTP